MCKQHQQTSQPGSITHAYEQQALDTFRQWYRESRPTIRDAALHASVLACKTVGSLTPTQVILLLQEHPDWTHRLPPEIAYNQTCLTIGEAARLHLVQHLEQVIQRRGLEETIEPDA